MLCAGTQVIAHFAVLIGTQSVQDLCSHAEHGNQCISCTFYAEAGLRLGVKQISLARNGMNGP